MNSAIRPAGARSESEDGRPWLAKLAASFLLVLPTVAEDAPAAATNPPALSPRAFQVTEYAVEGNSLLPASSLLETVRPFTGPAVDVDTIKRAVSSIVLAYRARGFVTVTASLPPQTLTNGIVRVVVSEGRLGDIQVVGNEHFSSNNVMRSLPSLGTNLFLNGKILQAELDRANSNPDRQIFPEIQPGSEPGTSSLVLKVKDKLPLHAHFDVNNLNTPGTPDLRINTSIAYNNLWQREHAIGFQYGFTPEEMKTDDKPFYDQPLIANYGGYYRMPLGAPRAVAQALTNQPSRFGYDEGSRSFRLPPARSTTDLTFFASRSTSDTGVKYSPASTVAQTELLSVLARDSGQDLTLNESVGFRFQIPMPEIGKIRSTLSVGPDLKHLLSQSFNTNGFYYTVVTTNTFGERVELTTEVPNAQPIRESSVVYLPLSLRWDAARPDQAGTTALGLSLSGNASFGPLSDAEAFKSSAGSTNASGDYIVVQANFSREQRLYKNWSALFKVDGQYASEPLVTSEMFGVGGVNSVRGYHEGELYGDHGVRVSLEPRTPMYNVGMVDDRWPMMARAFTFVDYGIRVLADPRRQEETKDLMGAGWGLNVSVGSMMDIRFVMAWPLNETPTTRAGAMRMNFYVGAQF